MARWFPALPWHKIKQYVWSVRFIWFPIAYELAPANMVAKTKSAKKETHLQQEARLYLNIEFFWNTKLKITQCESRFVEQREIFLRIEWKMGRCRRMDVTEFGKALFCKNPFLPLSSSVRKKHRDRGRKREKRLLHQEWASCLRWNREINCECARNTQTKNEKMRVKSTEADTEASI